MCDYMYDYWDSTIQRKLLLHLELFDSMSHKAGRSVSYDNIVSLLK